VRLSVSHVLLCPIEIVYSEHSTCEFGITVQWSGGHPCCFETDEGARSAVFSPALKISVILSVVTDEIGKLSVRENIREA
jgi:hypothetical protein